MSTEAISEIQPVKETSKHILYYDLLNICACLCVIFLHCNGIAHFYSNTLAWKQALLVEVGAYWAVPIFFMLSGATLMNYRKRYSTKEFFKKRFFRTVIPFLAWSVLSILILKIDVSGWTLLDFYNNIMLTRIQSVYWFFIPLFSVYLCMPLLSCLAEEKYRPALWYIAVISFFLQSFLAPMLRLKGITFNINVPVISGYVIFVFLGYLFSVTDFTKKQRYLIYVLGIMGAVFRYTVTYHYSTINGSLFNGLFDYTQFHSILLACAVFVFFKYINWEKLFNSVKSKKVISKISACSFGIYLIHMIVYHILNVNFGINANCWQWRLLMPFGIYAVSLALVLIIKKIPLVKHIVP